METTETANGDSTVLSLSYAYGPVTVAYSDMEYDIGTANSDVRYNWYESFLHSK